MDFNLHDLAGCERSPSFKERHPKFRKSTTPDYLLAAEQARTHKLQRQSSLSDPRRTPSPQNLSQQPAQPLDDSNQEINVDDSNEEINVDVVEEEEEVGPIDMSIPKRSATPPPPPYKYTPLSLLPPPSYSVVRPPPPPYPTCPPSPPHPISSTTKPETLPPPPSYESSTVKCSYPSPPSIKKDLIFNNPNNEEVSTTTPKKADRRRPRKGRCPTPPEHDDRPVREITIITGRQGFLKVAMMVLLIETFPFQIQALILCWTNTSGDLLGKITKRYSSRRSLHPRRQHRPRRRQHRLLPRPKFHLRSCPRGLTPSRPCRPTWT